MLPTLSLCGHWSVVTAGGLHAKHTPGDRVRVHSGLAPGENDVVDAPVGQMARQDRRNAQVLGNPLDPDPAIDFFPVPVESALGEAHQRIAANRHRSAVRMIEAAETACFGDRQQPAVGRIASRMIRADQAPDGSGRLEQQRRTAMPADVVECADYAVLAADHDDR
jgi:hypothetical protein